MRMRPPMSDELAVPAQHVAGVTNADSPPHPARQHPAERRQQHPIDLRQLRTSKLTLEHAQLVAKQQDLDLLLPFRAPPEHDQLKQAPQRPVEKRQNETA